MRSVLVFLLFIQGAIAGESCKKFEDCIELVTKLTGVKYIYPSDIKKDEVIFSSEIELSKDTADILFSEAFHLAGYTRLPTPVEKVLKIINARDIRYSGELPKYQASKTETPELPKHNDYIFLVYKGNPNGFISDIARNLRPFLSRYGRVIDIVSSQTMIVSDAASNIRNYLPIIKDADVAFSKEDRKRKEMAMKKNLEEMKPQSGFPAAPTKSN